MGVRVGVSKYGNGEGVCVEDEDLEGGGMRERGSLLVPRRVDRDRQRLY